MSYKVKQASLASRIGSGIGQGLAEQLPQEIAHGRKRAGLEELASQSGNLNPTEYLAKAASVYGITPQEIQSFTELSKQQNLRNAYAKQTANYQNANASPMQNNATTPNFRDIEFANLRQSNQQAKMKQPTQAPQTIPVPVNAYGQPQINPTNPISESLLTKGPWSPIQRDQHVNHYLKQGFTPDQARELASDDERRDLGHTEAEQKRYAELEETKSKAKEMLLKKIEKKTQKSGEELFKDVSGAMLNNLERGMERDLRENPKASAEDVTNDWSEKALELAKTQNDLKTLAKNIGISNIFKRKSTLQKLNQYSNLFAKSGNSEEYQKLLESEFKLSPHGAASIAFPLNDSMENYFKNAEKSGFKNQDARSIATQIQKYIKNTDSISSILRNIRDRFPGIDQSEILQQLYEDQDIMQLNARQKREIAQGRSEINPPGWADLYILGW